MDLIKLEIGQIWRDRWSKKEATSAFLISKIVDYADEGKFDNRGQLKVYGYQIHFGEVTTREMHENSLRQLFPYITLELRDPYVYFDTEDK